MRQLLLAGVLGVLGILTIGASSASALSLGLQFSGNYGQLDTEMWEVGKSGVDVYRIPLVPQNTPEIAPGEFDWGNYNRWFTAAAENGFTLLPIVGGRMDHTGGLPSTSEKYSWGGWVTQAVHRYGYNGEFWQNHPGLPESPAVAWEITNEPNLAWSASEYGQFVAWAGPYIQSASEFWGKRRTEVLLGGIYAWGNKGSYTTAMQYIRDTYNVSGVPNAITGVAIHPYELDPSSFYSPSYSRIEAFRYAVFGTRVVLNELSGGSGKTLWITEEGWPVGGPEWGISESEQASLVTQTFDYVKNNASLLNLQGIVWYNYRNSPDTNWAGYCGLRSSNGTYRPSWFAFEDEAGVSHWPPPPAPHSEEDYSPGPRAIETSFGETDAFFRDSGGGLGHEWHVPWSFGWSNEVLGGSVASGSDPHAIIDEQDETNVLYRTPSGGLGHAWHKPSTPWGTETLSGSLASSAEPDLLVDNHRSIQAFYRTPSGGLGHAWHEVGNPVWGSEVLPGSVASEPHAIIDKNGGINVFYRTSGGTLGHEWWEASGSKWGSETLAGTLASSAEPYGIVDPTNNVVHVFFRTPSGGLGHQWHTPWESGWGNEVLPGSLGADAAPHPVVDKNGGMNVFYRTPSGTLGHEWWEAGGTKWGNETLGGTLASEPHAIVDPTNNAVHVFYRTPGGGLGHRWHAPGDSVWGSETLPGSLASEPHPMVNKNGGMNVFYRTPSGTLGHEWWEAGGTKWGNETLSASIAARTPAATTGAATGIAGTEAKVEGTVNPEGSPTSYYFEYGTTTSYDSKSSAQEIGYGVTSVAASQNLSGLAPNTTYHYRLVATSAEGTTNGTDGTFTTLHGTAEALAALPVTEPFNGTSESLANFSSKWSTLAWAAGKGIDWSQGWAVGPGFPVVNGAYYNTTAADAGNGVAAEATMTVSPGLTNRYFSLWLDAQTPAGAKAGYELRFTENGTLEGEERGNGTYNVSLSKWSGGTQTVLASNASYTFAAGNSLAIVDKGSTVSAWTNTGSGFSQILSASDSSYSSGYGALEGAGLNTRLSNYKLGSL